MKAPDTYVHVAVVGTSMKKDTPHRGWYLLLRDPQTGTEWCADRDRNLLWQAGVEREE